MLLLKYYAFIQVTISTTSTTVKISTLAWIGFSGAHCTLFSVQEAPPFVDCQNLKLCDFGLMSIVILEREISFKRGFVCTNSIH